MLSNMRHGFLLIDKPTGVTSHDVVAQVRCLLPERSIGHLGTLDPAATGLLVLAVGRKALKVVELFSFLSKEYEVSVRFGAVSTTYDAEGVIEVIPPPGGWEVPEQSVVQRMIADRFLGRFQQVPPPYSAVHVGGERAYRKARQGRGVDLPSREVEVVACAIEHYAYPELTLRVRCGSGTYIRSLAHDLGQVLHCGGYLKALRRTRVGEWELTDAVPPEEAAWTKVIPLKEVMAKQTCVELSDAQAADIRFGRAIPLEVEKDAIGWNGGLPIAILIPMKDGTRNCRARKVL